MCYARGTEIGIEIGIEIDADGGGLVRGVFSRKTQEISS